MNRKLIAVWLAPVALAAWLVNDVGSCLHHKESRKAEGDSPLGLPTRVASHAPSGTQPLFDGTGSDEGGTSPPPHRTDGQSHGQSDGNGVRPVGPEDSVVLARLKRLQDDAPAVYAGVVSNLLGSGVNIASAGVVAPRVYGDLLRLRMFEDIRSSYEHRINDIVALEAIPQSKEAREDYIALQKRGMEVWDKVIAAQNRSIMQRIASETGVTESSMVERILALRPDGLLPDSSMTNGILRR